MSSRSIVSLVLGIVFLVSGIAKAIDSMAFAKLLGQYGFDFLGYFSPLIAASEIVLGMYLIFSVHRKTVSLITAILTGIFTLVYLYGYFFRGITDCGCFGTLVQDVPIYISLLRNIFIVCASIWLFKTETQVRNNVSGWKYSTIYVVGALAFCLSGYTVNAPLIAKTKPTENIQGKKIAETSLAPFSESVRQGKHAIFIFSPRCPHCWNATANVNALKGKADIISVFGIVSDNLAGDTSIFRKKFNTNFPIRSIPDAELGKLLKQVPALVLTNGGIIDKVYFGGDIPCYQVLEHPQLAGR